jgi:hypothetical protein
MPKTYPANLQRATLVGDAQWRALRPYSHAYPYLHLPDYLTQLQIQFADRRGLHPVTNPLPPRRSLARRIWHDKPVFHEGR